MKQRLVQMPHYFVSIFFDVILFCLFVPIYEQTANMSSQDGYKYFFFFFPGYQIKTKCFTLGCCFSVLL